MGSERTIHVLSLGAGVQSTTVYLMLRDHLDYAIFADTGDEPTAVYEHLKWLTDLSALNDGYAPILIRSVGRLSEDLMHGRNSTGQRFVSIPAYTGTVEGKAGKTKRQCTKEYKTSLIEQTIRRDVLGLKPRRRIPKDVRVYQYFWISADEAGRAGRIQERLKDRPWVTPRFPLITKWMTRADCLRWLEDKVPHLVPRSACVFCPFHSDQEWMEMQRDRPAEFDQAVQIDRRLRELGSITNRKFDQPLYLHRSLQPLDTIDFAARLKQRRPELPLFIEECEGMCGV